MGKTRNRRTTFSVGKVNYDKAIITKDITNFEALVINLILKLWLLTLQVQIYDVEVNWCYVEALTTDNSQNFKTRKKKFELTVLEAKCRSS